MKFANIFQDGLVLQREKELTLWGSAPADAILELNLANQKIRTCANLEDKFFIRVPALAAGGPYKLTLTNVETLESISINDVYIGEVYHASGQSNMDCTIEFFKHTQEETLPNGDLPLIREFRVKHATGLAKRSEVDGFWKPATSKNINNFSATAFYFARKMHQELGCAIGIINTSWGGIVAESFCSRNTLMQNPIFSHAVQKNDTLIKTFNYEEKITPKVINDYKENQLEANRLNVPPDTGNAGYPLGFANIDFDDSSWDSINLPALWKKCGFNYNGVLWFRKEIFLSSNDTNEDLRIIIGRIDKTDITYFNGEQIGATGGPEDESVWNKQRCYTIPKELLQVGRNIVTIRACSFAYDGAVMGDNNSFHIENPNNKDFKLSLMGEWKCYTEQNYGNIEMPESQVVFHFPSMAFNNMISPIIPFTLRGVIFYQGESNAGRCDEYYDLMELLIKDWRYHWANGNTPFTMVQLANFREESDYDANSQWAVIRDAQRRLAKLENVGTVTITDVGEADDIHPRDKKTVGERLAFWELNKTFGLKFTPAGPLFRQKVIERNKIRLFFDYAESGLIAKGDTLNGFYIANAEKGYTKATASIENNTVVLSSPEVNAPLYVRYAWSDNPASANLYNTENLPASPFEA